MEFRLHQNATRSEHFDRYTWSGFSFDAHGMLVGLRASNASGLGALRRVVPPGARVSDARAVDALYSLVLASDAEQTHVLYEDAQRTADSSDLDELLVALKNQLHFRIAVGARTRLFVHAGVVGWRGGAILIPGRTHSGKSSLVAALVRAGATYYSDEYAVLDDAGFVHPFARALGIRDASGRTHPVEAGALGGSVGDTPLPVSMVLVTHHVPGGSWDPRTLSPGETVLALLDNTLAVRSRPADTLRILTAAVTRATALAGSRGEAVDVADRILSRSSTFLH